MQTKPLYRDVVIPRFSRRDLESFDRKKEF